MWYFQRNCFMFKEKILKEVRLSDYSLILLEIQFVWNKGGQKRSLSIYVRCLVFGQIYFSAQNRWISCVHYLGKIYFISITIYWSLGYIILSVLFNSTQLLMEIFFTHSKVNWLRVHVVSSNCIFYMQPEASKLSGELSYKFPSCDC